MTPQTSRDSAPQHWKDYIPYKDKRVLGNIPSITTFDAWKRAEYDHADAQTLLMRTGVISINRTFDVSHAQTVHKALFDGFYEWAGQLRTVDIFKPPSSFAARENIETHLTRAQKSFIDYLKHPGNRDEFITAACGGAATWNYAHPFREGNGRTMKMVLEHFSADTPWQFDFSRVTPGQWNTAALLSMPGADTNWSTQPQELRPVFERITVDRDTAPESEHELDRSRDLKRSPPDLLKNRGFDPLGGQSPSKATGTGRPPGQQAHRQQAPQQGYGRGI